MTDAARREEQERCPNAAQHTYGPMSYIQWHAWAERMSKTHTQSRCPGCAFWLIAHPKATTS